jgi:pyruvate-formate lyase
MDHPFLKAQHYHDQAAQIRKLAAANDKEEARKALIEIAESYERLARQFMDLATARKLPRT